MPKKVPKNSLDAHLCCLLQWEILDLCTDQTVPAHQSCFAFHASLLFSGELVMQSCAPKLSTSRRFRMVNEW